MIDYSELSLEQRANVYRWHAQEAVASSKATMRIREAELYLSIASQWLRLADIMAARAAYAPETHGEADGRQAA